MKKYAECKDCGTRSEVGKTCGECGEKIFENFKSKCPCCKTLTGFSIPCQGCIDDHTARYDDSLDLYYVLARRGKLNAKNRSRGIWNIDPEIPRMVFFACFGCGAICTVNRDDVTPEGLHDNQCVTCGRCGIHQWPKFAGWRNKDKAPRKKP